jgi:hypothetical protein
MALIIKQLFILGQVLLLFFINNYAFHVKGGDNQTSLPVLLCGILFACIAISVRLITQFVFKSTGSSNKLNLIIFILFILLSLNFFLLDYFNVMVEYDRWIEKGMPVKPFWFE